MSDKKKSVPLDMVAIDHFVVFQLRSPESVSDRICAVVLKLATDAQYHSCPGTHTHTHTIRRLNNFTSSVDVYVPYLASKESGAAANLCM